MPGVVPCPPMISRLLFERWWLLCAAAVVIELILFAVWTRRRSEFAARAAWIALVATVVLPTVSHLVVTPRERIEKLCRDLASMVDAGDVSSIRRHLAEDFSAAGLGRDELLPRMAKTLTEYRVDHARLSRMNVTFPREGEAVATLNAVCTIRSPDVYVSRLLSRWRLSLREEADGWRIVSLKAVPTPLSPIRNLRDCLR